MGTEGKKAFVFDTNFIIQKKDLKKVIDNLSDNYSVYITQVSIEERIAQQCRELKTRFDEVEKVKKDSTDIADVVLKKTYDEMESDYQKWIQKKYEKAFQDRIIPFAKDGIMLRAVLNRANKKKPPFIPEGKSDKGFKDALIWESMLCYFKENGENEVFFITDDNGFVKNASLLCAEFAEITGKTISIQPTSFYRDLINPKPEPEPACTPKPPNVEQLREQICQAMLDLCYVQIEDYWGNEENVNTFFVNQLFDADYVRTVFENLKQILFDHVFETELPASTVLELDNRITDCEIKIPMAAIENAFNLYDEIMRNCPEYVTQFFSAAATYLNHNYKEQNSTSAFSELLDTDGELPF